MRLIAIDDLLPHLLEEQQLDAMLGCHFETAADALPLSEFVDSLATAQLHELRARSLEPLAGRPALRLAGQAGGSKQRDAVPLLFGKAYGINQAQLVCLLFSPFARREKPRAVLAVSARRHGGGVAVPAQGLARQTLPRCSQSLAGEYQWLAVGATAANL